MSCALQPLQSINLAQERSAEQDQQGTSEAGGAQKAKQNPAYVGPLAADQSSAIAQQLMQAQLQAHQLQGLGLQSHMLGQMPQGMMPNPDVVAAMAANPEAYRQLLNSMMVQRGRSASGAGAMPPLPPVAGHTHGHPPVGFNAHGLPMDSGLVGQYPQGLGSLPMDLQRPYASSTPSPAGHSLQMSDPYRLPQPSADHSSLAGAKASHQLPSAPPGVLGSDMNPQSWAWGAAPARLDIPNNPDPFSLNSHLDLMPGHPQELQTPAGASGHPPLPYGGEHRCVHGLAIHHGFPPNK